jgi:hypothetical protein
VQAVPTCQLDDPLIAAAESEGVIEGAVNVAGHVSSLVHTYDTFG